MKDLALLGPRMQKRQLRSNASKKIFVSLLMIGLIAMLISAGTYAYFSDTETSSGNTFTAGELDLKVDGKDDPNVGSYFTVGDVKPGDEGNVEIVLNNDGTIDGTADLHIKDVSNTEGTNPESETDTTEPGDLGAVLLITIQYDANGDGDYDDTGETIVTNESLNSLECQNKTLGALNASQSRNVKISWSLPAATGNDVQGDVVTFDIEFSLDQ